MKKALLILCLLVAAPIHAAVPRTMSYQGYLTNASGEPLNVTVDITFTLYATVSGGPALWMETHGSVVVSNGTFVVRLGSQTPLGLPFDQQYFLGVTLGADPEMIPRQPLTSVARAFRSSRTNAFVPNAVTTGAIQGGTITPDKLASSCAVGQILVRSVTGWQCGSLP
jgi:hypothetical protein